jgi:hypothetical protein
MMRISLIKIDSTILVKKRVLVEMVDTIRAQIIS